MTGNGASAKETAGSQTVALFPLQALPMQSQSGEAGVLPWQLPKAPPHTICMCLFDIGHYTKTRSKSGSTKYTETNTEQLLN